MPRPTPLVLDCDPGHDDMVAILLAAGSPAIDLRAITTVAGNGTLEQTTRNALLTCTIAGIRDVPVAAGCPGPLVGAALTAPEVHGASAMDGADLGEPTVEPVDAHAVELLAQVLRDTTEPVTLVPVGPLTNIALLLRRHPELRDAIGEVVVMGGTTGAGNIAPLAEFNILVDPEAAHVVFSSGLPADDVRPRRDPPGARDGARSSAPCSRSGRRSPRQWSSCSASSPTATGTSGASPPRPCTTPSRSPA